MYPGGDGIRVELRLQKDIRHACVDDGRGDGREGKGAAGRKIVVPTTAFSADNSLSGPSILTRHPRRMSFVASRVQCLRRQLQDEGLDCPYGYPGQGTT